MTTNSPFPGCAAVGRRASVTRLLLASACACLISAGASAQDDGAVQQLPDSLVNQQIPPSFPQDDIAPAGNGVPQTPPVAKTPGVPQTPPAGQTVAPSANVQQTPDGVQTMMDAAQAAVEGQAAQIPLANQIPAQPAQRTLVPATPMGVDAQSADSGQAQQAPPGTTVPAAAAPDQGLPIAAQAPGADMAAQDANAQGQGAEAPAGTAETEAPQSSGLPDALEQYTQEADSADLQGAATDDAGEALPEVNNLNMVRLQGDFANSSGNNVSVATGGQKPDAQLQEEIRTEAFDAAITGMFPLSPDQIETLLKKYDTTQKSVTKPPYDPPKPEISVQTISLDPGVMPPTVKTAVGNVTTINMLDATGAPWPVQDVTWAGNFEIVEPEEGGHIIRITPMEQFARGNIVIRMLTLKTPLTMTLETSRDIVQYRIDARIPEYGPFATAPLMQGAKSTLVAGSPDLTSLLDGVMPGGMQKLEVTGVDGRTTAYTMDGTTFVRTPLTLLSPAWKSSVSSADGMNVYALADAPVLLLSDGGEFMRATLKEKEELLDE